MTRANFWRNIRPPFYPTFMGLSGDAQATAAAAKAFDITYQKQPTKSGGYTLDHSAGTYLISPGGKTVLLSPFAQRPELWCRTSAY